jgi:putative oxidoreductase
MRSHFDDFGKLILRLTVGGCMLFHGVHKLLDFEQTMALMEKLLTNRGLPGLLKYGVLVGEVLVPVLLIIGLATRLAGLILACTMAMAVYLAHSQQIFDLNKDNSGGWAIELPALYFGCGLALAVMGGGSLGIWRRGGTLG